MTDPTDALVELLEMLDEDNLDELLEAALAEADEKPAAISESETEFLTLLDQQYREAAIGVGLDFSAVRRYWRGEAPLPSGWRIALAEKLCREQAAQKHANLSEQSESIYAWRLAGQPAGDWLDVWERVVVLLSPFVLPNQLANAWLPLADATSEPLAEKEWSSALGTAMQGWAHAIATGDADWQPVHNWLKAAGADSGFLASALASQERPWDQWRIRGLMVLRTWLTLAREQLQRTQVPEATWLRLLQCCRTRIADDLNELYPEALRAGIRYHCTLPLLRTVAASAQLERLLTPDQGSQWPVIELFQGLGLGLVLAESLEGFRDLLARLPDNASLRILHPPIELAERYPAAALLLEQQRFERAGVFEPKLDSPEALTWYRAVLGRVDADENGFESALTLLGKHLDETELDKVIQEHVFPSEQARSDWNLLDRIADTGRLCHYLHARNQWLQGRAASRLLALASTPVEGHDEDHWAPDAFSLVPTVWATLLECCQRQPELFIEHTLSAENLWLGRDSLDRWGLLWRATDDMDMRVKMIEAGFKYGLGRDNEHPALLGFLEMLYAEAPAAVYSYLAEESVGYFDVMIAALGRQDTPLLALVPDMAARYLLQGSSFYGRPDPLAAGPVCQALQRYPASFAALEEKAQIKLLPLFDDGAVLACADALAQLFTSASKTLRAPAVSLIARCSASTIADSGLLKAAPKARKPVLIGMALSEQAGMAAQVARHIADQAHDDYSRSISLDALERAGLPLEGLDPWAGIDLAGLQVQASHAKMPAMVGKCWNDAFASLLAPLGEPLGQFLLAILAEGGEVLPRRARQILAFLPAGRRSDLALLGVEQWIGADGATAFDWLLLPLPAYGDERAANALVKAVKDWKKARKQKASAAIRLLCQLPGNYGVAQARELWESGKFSDSIMENARHALSEAAQRQGMSLEEFLEQLVPDFGLRREGLKLDVGPYTYTVRIRPDLSLAVLDEKGKISKSLPKAKVGEDPDKRSLAENQFKALAKNLKPVLKQQGKRLTRGLQLGSSWPAATWRRLFAEHPLMASIAQGVVWAATDGAGVALGRFRPDDSGALLDLQDEDFALDENAQVHIVHPLELHEDERGAWAQHFSDYALVSPIGQWDIAVHLATAEELQAREITRANDSRLLRGKFGSLMEKWGYIKGAAEDGAMINEHTWTLDGERWLVTLGHSGVSAFFEPDDDVDIEVFTVSRRGPQGYARQRLGDLPPALLNTLLDQAEQLRAVAGV